MVLIMTAASLYISNFNLIKGQLIMRKKIKYFLSSFIFCSLIICCGKILHYILTDDTNSYTRIVFHEMYEQENIDVLFVGSSHCYRSFIPAIFDEELGKNTFNIGTSSQSLDGSYMIIKEAAKYNDIKHIYLELYYNVAFAKYKERTDLTQTYIISDYLKPSLDKVEYLLNASTKTHYPNSFIVARRNWSKLFDIGYIKNLLSKKRTNDYKNYEYTYINGDTEWYGGKGYFTNNETIKDWNYFSHRGWEPIDLNNFSEDWFNSLQDIITFCDQKGISLTFVSAPMPNFLITALENYDDYVMLVQDIIANTDVDYYDFNLCKEEYFPNTSSLFKDADHMNHYGAEAFSHLFADFINGEIPEDKLFYDSYKEKIEHLDPTVFGISYHISDNNGMQIKDCKIVSTGNENLEYEIILYPEEGDSFRVQEFSNNKFFNVSPDEHGVMTINYRLDNFPDVKWTTNISY